MTEFRVVHRSNQARAGVLETAHGTVETPHFMPVGTQATVKALTPSEIQATGARLLIANTYHLWLRPGPEVIAELGGLHQFMGWRHAIATDSGGFQAFSLAERTRLSEEGFEFSSHLDGRRCLLTPEESMRVQGLLGSDIALQLDVCPSAPAPRPQLAAAVERTIRWGKRCLAARAPGQALFGIVQGGTDGELRKAHIDAVNALPFDGLALGGFSVGEPPERMHELLREVVPQMDQGRPRYLMGVGRPQDLIRAIGSGVDLFDCVLPTRNARNGQAFSWEGTLSIKNAKYRMDPRPLDSSCGCPACAAGYSRAYLRHLYLAKEILAHRLLTEHNLHLYGELVRMARSAIRRDSYDSWAASRLDGLER